MNLNLLKIFHAAATEKSFTRASDKLFLTQPGISKHIRELEEYYHIRLFERLGRRIKLTYAGEVLFKCTQLLFQHIEDVEKKIKDITDKNLGWLKINSCFSAGVYILPSVIREFIRKYPAVKIEFDISTSQTIINKILAQAIDLGIITLETNQPRIVSRLLFEDELVLILPGNHKLKDQAEILPADLAHETLLLSKPGSGTRELVEREFIRHSIRPRNIMSMANPLAIKKAVEAGLGLSIMSGWAHYTEVSSNLLITRKIRGMNLKRNYNIVHLKGKYLPDWMKEFMSILSTFKSGAAPLVKGITQPP
jgi:DNA-binding transcriptional LysR family regulator